MAQSCEIVRGDHVDLRPAFTTSASSILALLLPRSSYSVADAAPQLLLAAVNEEERGAIGLHHFAHAAEEKATFYGVLGVAVSISGAT